MGEKLCKSCGKTPVGKGRRLCDTCRKKQKKLAAREYKKRAYVKPCDAVLIRKLRPKPAYRPPMTAEEQETLNLAVDAAAGERMALEALYPVGLRYMRGALI